MNNSRKGKKNKVKPGYGIRDFYQFYKKEYDSKRHNIGYKKYKDIIKEYNQEIVEAIVFNNYHYTLPYRLGEIALRKLKPEITIDNGKIKNKNPVDIKSTMQLWEKDAEAKEKKILVRYTNKHSKGYIFFVKYFKTKANFKNKTVYKFVPFRKVQSLINKAVTEYNIDTYII